ncbi:MAG: cation:proton antiporter [Thermoplasmata archaeon]
MNISLSILHFLILISISLVVSRIFSLIGNRYFGFPAVIGELITGMIIGPYALGSIPFLGFTIIPQTSLGLLAPVSSEIPIPQAFYMFGQIGVIMLLFQVGLSTDLKKFIIAIRSSVFIAIGESMIPFIFGFIFMLFFVRNINEALFIGVILTASSTGITAKVLTDLNRLNSREGMAIMTSTVIVDVISITLLTIITGMENSSISLYSIIILILKVMLFWGISLFIGIKLKKYIIKFFKIFRDNITLFSFILLILFLVVSLSVWLDLTIIVGAYSFGLILSILDEKNDLIKNTENISNFFTPIFFVSIGMMVDLRTLSTGMIISIIILLLAVLTKVLGAAFPAKLLKYNTMESIQIGLGLLSMGEVALILAGNALLYNIINNEIYSVAIFVTIGTTIIAPIIFARTYRKKDISND